MKRTPPAPAPPTSFLLAVPSQEALRRFRRSGGRKTGGADKEEGEAAEEVWRAMARDLTFNLQGRQTSEGVIFQLAAETNCREPEREGSEACGDQIWAGR